MNIDEDDSTQNNETTTTIVSQIISSTDEQPDILTTTTTTTTEPVVVTETKNMQSFEDFVVARRMAKQTENVCYLKKARNGPSGLRAVVGHACRRVLRLVRPKNAKLCAHMFLFLQKKSVLR